MLCELQRLQHRCSLHMMATRRNASHLELYEQGALPRQVDGQCCRVQGHRLLQPAAGAVEVGAVRQYGKARAGSPAEQSRMCRTAVPCSISIDQGGGRHGPLLCCLHAVHMDDTRGRGSRRHATPRYDHSTGARALGVWLRQLQLQLQRLYASS